MANLTIERLTKKYGANTILKGISTQIEDGELVSLLGPSGCGKTTTLRCIAGFEAPDSGFIRTDGVDITGLLPEKRDIGMVFQNYALFPHMTVFENVAFGLRMRRLDKGEIKARVEEALSVVGLDGKQERFPRQLSGGQQQRVAIARAIVIRPRLLLLDEPLANLDAKLREEMRFYLKKLQKEVGITMIYVTHDQGEALVLSDRILVMKEGEVLQDSTPKEIYCRPRSLEVAKFIGLTNLFAGKVKSAATDSVTVSTALGDVVAGHCPEKSYDVGEAVTVAVRPESLHLVSDTASTWADFNVISGDVTQKIFMGSCFDYRLGAASSESIRIQTPPAIDLEMASTMHLAFAPADTMVFADKAQGE